MADKKAVPLFAPDGTVRLIPADQVDNALRAGGQVAVKMQDPRGTARWIRESDVAAAKQAGGSVIPDRPDTPQGVAHILFGDAPVSNTISNIWSHAKNFVTGPIHAFTEEPSDQEKTDIESAGGAADPLGTGIYRLTAEPTVNALRQIHEQWKAKNFTGGGEDYDAQGHYKPSVLSSAVDAIPIVGPWARNIETEAHKQGVLPALAGAAMDIAAPEAASMAGKLPAAAARGAREVVAPTARLDRPIVGDPAGLTPRERYRAARGMGVNLDAAQATNSPVARGAKAVTEHSLAGGGMFEDNNTANLEALQQHAKAIQDATASEMSREDFGRQVSNLLRQHKAKLQADAGHPALAQAILDSATPRNVGLEELGSEVHEALMKHLRNLQERSGETYESLDKSLGQTHPDVHSIEDMAQDIIKNSQGYYGKHPELLKGDTARAWTIVQDLAKKGDVPDSWADLHRLRSDLMDLYRSGQIVGDVPTGWLKQIVGKIDETMNSAAATPGMTEQQRFEFQQANSLYKRMKEMYDTPSSPFYSLIRDKEGLNVGQRIANLKPAAMRQFSEAMGDLDSRNIPGPTYGGTVNPSTPGAPKNADLVKQAQRQAISQILDPAGNGEFDLDGLAARWNKIPKEHIGSILDPSQISALNDLAKATEEGTVYDRPGTLRNVVSAEDGTKAADALKTLTPQETQQVKTAAQEMNDTSTVPQLQRDTISRLLNEPENDTSDLRNFPSRFTRTQKSQLESILTPEQIEDLGNLASVSKQIHADTNPSGSGKLVQKVGEAAAIPATLGSSGTELALGHPVAAAATLAVPAATAAAQRAIAAASTSPEVVDSLMKPRAPIPPAKRSPVAAGQAVASQQEKSDETYPDVGIAGTSSTANQGVPPPDKPGMTPLPSSNTPISSITPPPGATHEVLAPNGQTVTGHLVDGNYVPLEQPE